jgi:hypothetical protein
MGNTADRAGFGDALVLETDIVLARARLSPLAIARARRAGRLEMRAEEGGRAFLEVGGVLVAEGKIVKRGGRSYLKVGRLLGRGGEVEA